MKISQASGVCDLKCSVQAPSGNEFFQRFERDLNERQLKVIRRMFEAGPEVFSGGINARKYIALTGSSKATATRDLQELARVGALTAAGGGRSTRYELPGT